MTHYIFNTSFYVGNAYVEEWKRWLNDQLIASVESQMAGLNRELYEVISAEPDENRIFSLQWRCRSLDEVEQLDSCVAPALGSISVLFKEDVTHFSSVMQKIL